jgi:hypothetical protein
MTLPDRLAAELSNLVGHAGPPAHTVSLVDPSKLELAVDFTLIDKISCAFEELRLDVPTLVSCDIERLKQWAQSLSSRVTYLLENLGPIEIDTQAGQVLIRSTPPDQQPDGTTYYEILLESQTSGRFTLRRFEAIKGTAGRTPVDIQTTHEMLRKLVGDLVETIPAA